MALKTTSTPWPYSFFKELRWEHRQTLRCIVCLSDIAEDEQLLGSGFVIKGDEMIIASWCEKCAKFSTPWWGHWVEDMGIL